MTEAIAAAAKALLKKLAVDLVFNKDKRNKFLLIAGSIVVGLIFFAYDACCRDFEHWRYRAANR